MESSGRDHLADVRHFFEKAARLDDLGRAAVLGEAESEGMRDSVEALLSLYDRITNDTLEPSQSPWDELSAFARTRRVDPDGDGQPSAEHALSALLRVARAGGGSALQMRRHRVLNRYEIQERIGRGGMGEVFRARDVILDREVALKYVAPEVSQNDGAVRRLIEEARIASRLDHPHIGYIHEVAEDEEGRLFIAMAYYPGETLRDRIRRGPIEPDEACRIARAVADALAQAHAAGIVHRDVNPGNVMLTEGGGVRLIDFGIATVAASGRDLSLPNAGHERAGTVAYMSPEQARGEEAGPQADVWALGVMLHEMVAGSRPFHAPYEAALLYEIQNADPEPIPSAPDRVAEIVERCLCRDVSERYADASELLRALDAPGRRQGRTRRGTLLTAGAGMIGLISIAIMTIWPMTEARVPYVAVLPFNVLGAGDDADVISAGMMESLTSRLSELRSDDSGLWIVPSREIGPTMGPEDVRSHFGATTVVTGSMQFAGEQVRLTLNIVDTRTRRVVASTLLDLGPSSRLALQDAAARAVARLLRVHVQDVTEDELHKDPEAVRLYLIGRGYLRNQQSLHDVDTAIAHFGRAIELVPDFSDAHAALGGAYWEKYHLTADVALADSALRTIGHALAIGGESATALATRGLIQASTGALDAALESLDRAAALAPSDPEIPRRQAGVLRRLGRAAEAEAILQSFVASHEDLWAAHNSLGVFLYHQGRYDEALAAYDRGLSVAPANATLLVNAAVAHWTIDELDEAAERLERVLRSRPDHSVARANLATLYFYSGRFHDAAGMYETEVAARPHDHVIRGYLADALHWIPERRAEASQHYRAALHLANQHVHVRPDDAELLATIAGYHARLGEDEEARERLARVQRLMPAEDADPGLSFAIGELYEAIGDRELALEWMIPALDRDHGTMQLRYSPWLESLRGDPAVAEYITR